MPMSVVRAGAGAGVGIPIRLYEIAKHGDTH
jgi:hypothetical protein